MQLMARWGTVVNMFEKWIKRIRAREAETSLICLDVNITIFEMVYRGCRYVRVISKIQVAP